MAVALDSPLARPLVVELDAELSRRYGGGEDVQAPASEFTPPDGLFVVLLLGDEAVACGGFRPLRPGIAELKRMYVRPDARGTGLGRRLLGHLETAARQAGHTELWLETGTEQPEAMALYASAGYTPIPSFGQFADSPRSRCYGKALVPTPSSRAPLS